MAVTPELIPEEAVAAERRRREENLSRLHGKYAHLPGGSEEFSAQKAAEKALEERHWQLSEKASPEATG